MAPNDALTSIKNFNVAVSRDGHNCYHCIAYIVDDQSMFKIYVVHKTKNLNL